MECGNHGFFGQSFKGFGRRSGISAKSAGFVSISRFVRKIKTDCPTAVFYDFGSSQPKKNIAAKLKRQVDQNEKALSAVVRQTAVIAAAQTVLNVDFDTYDEAVSLRDELADVLDTEIVSTENVELAQTLQDLQKTLIEAMTERSADLKTVSSYENKSVLPACVIAYELYGDYAKADEIVSRNKIKNPLFVPANKTLEVLV